MDLGLWEAIHMHVSMNEVKTDLSCPLFPSHCHCQDLRSCCRFCLRGYLPWLLHSLLTWPKTRHLLDLLVGLTLFVSFRLFAFLPTSPSTFSQLYMRILCCV